MAPATKATINGVTLDVAIPREESKIKGSALRL